MGVPLDRTKKRCPITIHFRHFTRAPEVLLTSRLIKKRGRDCGKVAALFTLKKIRTAVLLVKKKSSQFGVRKAESIVYSLEKKFLQPFNGRMQPAENTLIGQEGAIPLTKDKHFQKNIVLYTFVSIKQLSACGANCFNIIPCSGSFPDHSFQVLPFKRLAPGFIPPGYIYIFFVAHSID